jgi:hypothetical protein
MARGGDTKAAAAANGKKVGRPAKPKIEQKADSGIATTVLAMDGPPDHQRICGCRVCANQKKLCACTEQCGDCGKLEENCSCEKFRVRIIPCETCLTVERHKECHCELCGWWEALLAGDSRLRKDTRVYLTDRRDGKPAQGIFTGDTREVQSLSRGNVPSYFAGSGRVHPSKADKPN